MARPRHPRARNRAYGPYRISTSLAALAGLAMMLVASHAWAASTSLTPPTSAEAPGRGPNAGLARMLNGAGVRAVGLGRFPKWTGALGRSAIEGEGAWTKGLVRLRGRDRRGQIEAVNQMVNRAPYRDDAVNYGLRDYWATPAELFTRGGDCEDYAFAKFTALRALGFSNRDLRLVVVYDLARGIPHAVLAVDLGSETLILDSQFNTIFAAARLRRYLPYYSVNEKGGWIHIAGWTTPRTATARGKSTGSLAPAAAAP